MNRRRIPFTRLSIVFILAMVLSGGVLTYFSINNISNLKELTEKRILEEQQALSVWYLDTLQEKLEKLGAELINNLDQIDAWRLSMIQLSDSQKYIIQAFLIRNESRFIFPYFTGISEESTLKESSSHFREVFQLGESAEFDDGDLPEASTYYLSCLNLSTTPSDSAAALNALGRVSVKSDHMEEALVYYSQILQDFTFLTDRNGFPYAYYALASMMHHASTYNLDQVRPLISLCLDKMELGQIPLNYQTEEILFDIAGWSRENFHSDSSFFSKIDQSIFRLDGQLQFINQFGDELKLAIAENTNKNLNDSQAGFRIANLSPTTESRFLLFIQTSPYTSGFLMDRRAFFASIANTDLQKDMEFEYRLEFPVDIYSSTTLDNPIYTTQLHPFFPNQNIKISLLDEGLLSDLVKRRSWIYGVATFLLLTTMMLGIILTLRDIAREKHLAHLRSDFISNVTHELKTPLTSIRMYAESLMMRRMKSSSGQQKYLSVIINESERLKRMINNILEFSKMEKTRQDYHMLESNVSEVLERAILDMKYWLDKDGFNLKTDIMPDAKAMIDPEKIYQVYTNLLSNAIKYSGESRNINIRLYSKNDSVVTEVEDEGIGIAKDQQTRIFDEFYRVEHQESGNITGTGLGLTVVKEIVDAHHGKIEVESEIGKGSRFSVILYQS